MDQLAAGAPESAKGRLELTRCPVCEEQGWPLDFEKIQGEGEPWGRGKIPEALKKPPAASGPVWGSKLGSTKAPGASVHCGPGDISKGPWCWYEDIRMAGGSGHVLIDARSRVLHCTPGMISAWGMEGKVHFTITQQNAGMSGCPALVGNSLYAGEFDGMLHCYDLKGDMPVLKWSSTFCKSLAGDPSTLAANEDIVVGPGMDEPPVPGAMVQFNSHMYGVDATTGKLRWSAKLPMPSLMLVPTIAGDSVVYMSSSGAVDCVAAKDGKAKWQAKGEMGSMSTGGAVVYGQLVFATCNKRAKKTFNAPFGGKGAARAYSLKDGSQVWEQLFDMEANVLPAVCTNGPGGKAVVICCLGSSPGQPAGKLVNVGGSQQPCPPPNGDHWNGRIVALEAQSGEVLWKHELPQWNAAAAAGNYTWGNQGLLAAPPSGWTPPVVGADGLVYACWNANGTLYAVDGATGNEVSKWNFGHPMFHAPVIGPGVLAVAMHVKGFCMFAQEWPQRGKEVRPLELPFTGPDGSGTEHFWPMKANDPTKLGTLKFKATKDLTKPAWVFKTPLKLIDCWYGNSPVMDAQRNVYMGGNWSDIFVIRPDGTLRGSLFCGPYYSTPALWKEFLFVADCLGHMRCFNIETLELKWCVKYTGCTQSDNYALTIHEDSIIAPGNEFWPDSDPGRAQYGAGKMWYDSGHRWAYRLNCETGETIWRVDFNAIMRMTATELNPVNIAVLWNFTPVVFDNYVCFMDMESGAYCCRWSDSQYCWHHEGENGRMSTGNQCCGSNGILYITGNTFRFEQPPGQWNNCEGVGELRAFDIRSGERKFAANAKDDRDQFMACNQGPLLFQPKGGGPQLVAAPFSCNLTGSPLDPGAIRSGDAWSGKLVAYNAETGEEVWGRQWDEYWTHTHVAGSFYNDPGMVWPDSWGGLSVDSEGVIYCHWQDGMVYRIDGANGDILSRYDTGNSSNAQVLLAPGMAVYTGGFAIFCFRDPEVEAEWQAEAKEQGDPRAKAPLMDIITPSEDSPPRKEWEVWRGPVYAEEHNHREGARWIEEFTKISCKFIELNEEYSRTRAAAGPKKASGGSSAKGKGTHWVVVGGGSNGIVVRAGKDLKSDEAGRLSKGAKLEQVKKEGERLQFKKLEGEGPETGWVSLTFKGSPLVQPV